MNPEEERKRFRKQFNDTQWSDLLANPEFKSAWDGSNLTRAGEIAPRVLYPAAKTKKRETGSKAIDKTVGRVHLDRAQQTCQNQEISILAIGLTRKHCIL